MGKEFIEELQEIIDAAIDEKKVATLILMSCDSDGNACVMTRGNLLDQAVVFSELRKTECIEKIEKAASLINNLIVNDDTPDDREI